MSVENQSSCDEIIIIDACQIRKILHLYYVRTKQGLNYWVSISVECRRKNLLIPESMEKKVKSSILKS